MTGLEAPCLLLWVRSQSGVVTTTIRLQFDGRSMAVRLSEVIKVEVTQDGLLDPLAAVMLAYSYLFIYLGLDATDHVHICKLMRWLQPRFNCYSTAVLLLLDCNSTAFDDIRYDRRHCGLENKQISVTAQRRGNDFFYPRDVVSAVLARAMWLGGSVAGCLSQPVLYLND